MRYNSSINGAAVPFTLTKQDTNQNTDLTIALSAMRSSTVISFNAESGTPPLATHIMSLPPSYPISEPYSTQEWASVAMFLTKQSRLSMFYCSVEALLAVSY